MNKIKKLYWNLWYPFQWEWVFFVSCYVLFLITGDLLSVLLAPIPFLLVRLSKRKVNEYFAYYSFLGKYLLFQNGKKSGSSSCQEGMRRFSRAVKHTIEELPPGKYAAITHSTVIQRLRKAKSVVLMKEKMLYIDNLLPELSRIVGRNCRKCPDRENCKFSNHPERDFFLVRFTKLEGGENR